MRNGYCSRVGSRRSRFLAGARVVYLLAFGAFGCIEVPVVQPPVVDVAVVVLDASTSSAVATRCHEAAARASELTGRERRTRLDLLVLATGGPATDGEPQALVGWLSFEPSAEVLFENPARQAKVGAATRTQFRAAVKKTCLSGWQAAPTSAVYRAVARAGDAVRARCVDHERAGRTCGRQLLLVHSDMRESVYQPLARQLASRRAGRRADAVAPLALAGIDVVVCGVAETRGSHQGRHLSLHAVRGAWESALGVAIPAFAPTCPRFSEEAQ